MMGNTRNSKRIEDGTETLILKVAISSRILLLTLIFIFRAIINPYDTSSLLNAPCLSSCGNAHRAEQVYTLFPRLGSMIERSIVWDSVYFIRIAECGYEYEQYYAFLPLFPLCVFVLSRTVFAPFVLLIGFRAVLALTGYVLNNAVFVYAAIYLYRVSIVVLKDSKAAMWASILFCFNPASIFYSSIYSESVYSFFAFGGLHYLLSGSSNVAALFFALSGSARSNGVLNAGYFCFQAIHQTYDALFLKKHARLALQILFFRLLQCTCIFLPFIAFQAYGYLSICMGSSSEKVSPWCKNRVPLLYNYIQSYYWGVGFLRYFQFRQLPNFLLASPILYLAMCSISHFGRLQSRMFFSLGFQCSNLETRSMILKEKCNVKSQENQNEVRQRTYMMKQATRELSKDCDLLEKPQLFIVPCTIHLALMAATTFFIMHVQVSTRFLSSNPVLYWYASHVMSSGKRLGYLIWAYSIAYILVGSLLFSTFYPFT